MLKIYTSRRRERWFHKCDKELWIGRHVSIKVWRLAFRDEAEASGKWRSVLCYFKYIQNRFPRKLYFGIFSVSSKRILDAICPKMQNGFVSADRPGGLGVFKGLRVGLKESFRWMHGQGKCWWSGRLPKHLQNSRVCLRCFYGAGHYIIKQEGLLLMVSDGLLKSCCE